MCTYRDHHAVRAGEWEGSRGLVRGVGRHRLLRPPRPRRRDHTLNIDLLNPARGAGARVALELDPASARALADAILHTLGAVPRGLLGVPVSPH